MTSGENNPRPEAANGDRRKMARVTLENLIRFKRNEQPPAEFWQQFDRELRAKQLAAIVAKRPWWTPLARYSGVISRYPVPLGAVAACAIAFAGFHEYRVHVQAGPSANGAQNIQSSFSKDSSVADSGALPAAPVSSEADSKLAMASGDRAVANVVAFHDGAKREAASPRMDSRALAFDAGSEATVAPSEQWIAANLAAAQAAEPEVVRNLLGLSTSLDDRMIPTVRERAEPLEQMSPPTSERRSRLLGGVVPALATYGGDVPAPVSDRFVKELSDDRLYESVSRYSEGADHISIKVKF
ncbi:MAG: hypothetical protein ABSA05_07620 [Opitutaceae bacterium]|jgi:hypothetical protein